LAAMSIIYSKIIRLLATSVYRYLLSEQMLG
jgi:hypothetical protein